MRAPSANGRASPRPAPFSEAPAASREIRSRHLELWSCEVLLSQPVPPTRGAHFGARSTDPAGLSAADLSHPAPQLRAVPVHLHPRLPHDRTFAAPRNPQAKPDGTRGRASLWTRSDNAGWGRSRPPSSPAWFGRCLLESCLQATHLQLGLLR